VCDGVAVVAIAAPWCAELALQRLVVASEDAQVCTGGVRRETVRKMVAQGADLQWKAVLVVVAAGFAPAFSGVKVVTEQWLPA